MSNFILMTQHEFIHFARSPFKTVSLILFIGAALYGMQNGYILFSKHNAEIATIESKNEETVQEVRDWLDAGITGPEGRPWIDVSKPFWAIWYTPTYAYKKPSPLMPFTIGQSEQYGYYKRVTNWSTTFDSDLAEEIANPERLALGTLDFSFIILYLLPVLMIVLLFNIGGLEKDLDFDRLIQVNNINRKNWLLARFAFYFLLLILVLLSIMLPYAAVTGAIHEALGSFLLLFLFITLYLLIWFGVFYIINLYGKGSTFQALKMITVWLLFCIIIPGSIHQITSLKYPVSYMTEYIDAQRDETYKIWDLPTDSIRNRLMDLYPILTETQHGKDSIADKSIISNSSSGLVNDLMKNTAFTIENSNENKNQFIQRTYWINPVSYFQNVINRIASNDYYSYQKFRNNIQSMIDKKVYTLLVECWEKEIVTKEKYLEYVAQLQQ